MLLEGVLFLAALPAIYKCYHEVSGVLTCTLMAFIAIFAIGACIFTCFFSVNESKDVVTTASKIHGAGSVIGFMLFLFVPLLIAILSFKNDQSVIGVISIICFVAALVFFALFVMSDKEEFANTAIANEGLWQRLNLIFMYLPMFIIAFNGLFKLKE
jgi:phosphotransferase system  glucose/maltose/N-acetylglucosamine-specific IIC component